MTTAQETTPKEPVVQAHRTITIGPGGEIPEFIVPGGYNKLTVHEQEPNEHGKVYYNLFLTKEDNNGNIEASVEFSGYKQPPISTRPKQVRVGEEYQTPRTFPSKLQDWGFLKQLGAAATRALGLRVLADKSEYKSKEELSLTPMELDWGTD